MITEEDLVELNKLVYYVDENYKGGNPSVSSGIFVNKVLDGKNAKFLVLDTKNGEWGFKGMAVAPVVDGVPDTSQVIIVAAGTDPSKPEEVASAVLGLTARGSAQTGVAEEYVSEIINSNPDWNVSQLTGYSQSAYMLKIGARRRIPTTVFNGWIRFDKISEADKDLMVENSDLLINYRQNDDKVAQISNIPKYIPNVYNIPRDTVLTKRDPQYFTKLSNDFGTMLWLEGDSHDLSGWQFDEQGRILIPDTPENQDKKIKQEKQAIAIKYRQKVNYLKFLERKFWAKGAITPNEQIYLDDSNALAFVEKLAFDFKLSTQKMIKMFQKAIDEAEQPWHDIQTEVFRQITALTFSEVYAEMEAVGVTKRSVVLEPIEIYTQKLQTWMAKEKHFDELIEKIKTSISEIVALDEDLANKIKN